MLLYVLGGACMASLPLTTHKGKTSGHDHKEASPDWAAIGTGPSANTRPCYGFTCDFSVTLSSVSSMLSLQRLAAGHLHASSCLVLPLPDSSLAPFLVLAVP